MTLEHNPASFESIDRGSADRPSLDTPPAEWEFEGASYRLVRDDEGWAVLSEGRLLGRVEAHPTPETRDALQWRIRDPEHDGVGVGASWADWRDAVITLIDYRRRRPSA